jgi:hypothetical protein
MNSYQTEQFETLTMIRCHLKTLSRTEIERLKGEIGDYIRYRSRLNRFLKIHFQEICTQACFLSRRSACCSKDGIITFFADMLVNALISTPEALDYLERRLQTTHQGHKCVYLGPSGCLWQLKPIVCETFLCDTAMQTVFEKKSDLKQKWQDLKAQKNNYTWPDRPVLFDALEQYFLEAGHASPLMYCHNSPGLLRIKQQAQKRKR